MPCLHNLDQTLYTLFMLVLYQRKFSDRYVSVLRCLIVWILPIGAPDNMSPLIKSQFSGGLNVPWKAMTNCHSKGRYFQWLVLYVLRETASNSYLWDQTNKSLYGYNMCDVCASVCYFRCTRYCCRLCSCLPINQFSLCTCSQHQVESNDLILTLFYK